MQKNTKEKNTFLFHCRWACLALIVILSLCAGNNAIARNMGASLQSGSFDLTNVFMAYMGRTRSIDSAEFAETVLGTDGVSGITTPIGTQSFCAEVTVPLLNIKLAKATGLLYDNGSLGTALEGVGLGCRVSGLTNLFSGFVCTYENILSDVLGDAICSFQYMLESPVQLLATLYIVCIGILFATGVVSFTASEAVMSLLKVAAVVTITLNSDFTVYVLYRGVMTFAQQGTNMMFESVDLLGIQSVVNGANGLIREVLDGIGITTNNSFIGGLSGYGGILQTMDQFINDFVSANTKGATDVNCEGGALKMTLGLFTTVPIIGAMGLGLMFMLAMLLVKVLFSYLTALTGIMFLVSLAPMFISFSLFHFTEKLFSSWVKYLIGYALQIIIVFAFVSFASSLGLNFLFKQLYAQAAPVDQTTWVDWGRASFNKQCTFCTKTEMAAPSAAGLSINVGRKCSQDPTTGSAAGNALQPLEQSHSIGGGNPADLLSLDKGFISFATERMILMMVIAKLLSSILEQAPAIAAAITKVDYHDSRTKIAKGSGKNTEKSTTTTKQSYSLRQATTEKKPNISDSNQLVAKR